MSTAAHLQPQNLDVQNRLAVIAMANGRTGEAIQRFQALLRADRAQADVWLNLGLAYAITGNCDDARQAWETVLAYRPGDPAATNYLAGLCQYTAQ